MPTTTWKSDEKKLIQFMKRHPIYIRYEDYRACYKGSIDAMWFTISEITNLPIKDIREKWKRIKKNYFEHLKRRATGKLSKSGFNKYSDGILSFLDKYYMNKIRTVRTRGEPEVVVIDSDENSEEKDFFTLDLTMIDELLASRGGQEDIEMSRMDTILSLVSKRIDETLLSYTAPSQVTAKVVDPETTSLISVDSDSNKCSDAEAQDDPDFASSESQSPLDYNTHDVSPSMVEPINNNVDMETLFDIHRACDSNRTFYQELGRYVERFPKEKQEEIRLKICCLVTEAELDEVE